MCDNIRTHMKLCGEHSARFTIHRNFTCSLMQPILIELQWHHATVDFVFHLNRSPKLGLKLN